MKENLRPSSFRLLSHKSIKSIANYRKSIKINNCKDASDWFVSISNINWLISIDYNQCLISIKYQRYQLDTPYTRRWRFSKVTKQRQTRRCKTIICCKMLLEDEGDEMRPRGCKYRTPLSVKQNWTINLIV